MTSTRGPKPFLSATPPVLNAKGTMGWPLIHSSHGQGAAMHMPHTCVHVHTCDNSAWPLLVPGKPLHACPTTLPLAMVKFDQGQLFKGLAGQCQIIERDDGISHA